MRPADRGRGPPERETPGGHRAGLNKVNGNTERYRADHTIRQARAAVREIVARRRHEDRRREFAWALDRLDDAAGAVSDLLTELENSDCALTIRDVRKAVDHVETLLMRATPALWRV